MMDDCSQPAPRQARTTGTNASVSLADNGSATASTLHSALSSDPDLTGLQASFSMASNVDQTPREIFSNPMFSEFATFETDSFELMQGSSHYALAPSASSVHPRFVTPSSTDIDGVSSHQPGTGPWTHVDATEGPSSVLPNTMDSNKSGNLPESLKTPVHARAVSSASGHITFRDSAYGTGSRRSQHPSDLASTSDAVEQPSMNSTPTRFPPAVPPYTSSQSSTITPTPVNRNRPASESGKPLNRRSQKRSTDFECEDCDFQAKTKSEFKKHCARHKREYKCLFENCGQSKKGFATINDRDRHMKAVHKINNRNSRSYKCFGEGCNSASKEWPRLDNFKQHLKTMHGEDKIAALLKMSNDWYEQKQHQQPQADEMDSSTASDPAGNSGGLMLLDQHYQMFQNTYSNPGPFNNSISVPQGNQMARSRSHENPNIDPNLGRMSQPGLSISTGSQPQRLSNSPSTPAVQRQRAQSTLNMNSFQTPEMSMQKTRSQSGYPQYQDQSYMQNMQNNFSNQRVGFAVSPSTLSPWTTYGGQTQQARMSYPGPSQGQLRGARRPHTVAGPDLNPSRITELASPQDMQPSVQDLGGSQEDFLGFVGGSTIAGNGPGPSSHHDFQVSVTQHDQSPNEGRVDKSGLMDDKTLDEIHLLINQLRAKQGNAGLSDMEILSRFRLSLGSDAVTSYATSSVGPGSVTTDPQMPRNIKCPKTKETYLLCPICNKPKKRLSDLKKHMQRHSKPYGCVFDGCHKAFGSKNDWQRHEQSLHEQQECWRCAECAQVFFQDQAYFDHMRKEHSVQCPEDNAKDCRIARRYQGRFWCGFCLKIIVHSCTDRDAFIYRFNHIANHFTKENRASKDWVELTGKGKTKKELQEERDQSTQEDDDVDALHDPQEHSESTPTPSSHPSDSSSLPQTFGMQVSAATSISPMMTTGPTHHQAASDVPPRPSRQKFLTCCQCQQYTNARTSPQYCMCNHRFCSRCELDIIDADSFEEDADFEDV